MKTGYKRCKRYNIPGDAHALTFSCFQRQTFLTRERSRQWFADGVNLARNKHGFHVWAYVVMPEHVHLLVWPSRANYDISLFLTTMKQSVTRRAVLYVRRSAPHFLEKMVDRQPNGKQHYRFWQRGGGYDRNLTEPTTIWTTIDYIHANPVRRRLCERPVDWQWSSAADYANLRQGPIELNLDSLPRTAEG